MRLAIIDDEKPARRELIYLIRQCAPDAEILEASQTDAFLDLLREQKVQACFVDINLGGANGTTLASMIQSIQPEAQIVFATAYREYAVKAFELGAADYLLKPFDLERVRKTMERIERMSTDSGNTEFIDLKKLMVSMGTGFRVLDVEDIIYIEAENRACRIHTAEKSYLQNATLSYYENRLRDGRFFRAQKSYLVNLEKVKDIVPFHNGGYGLRMKGCDEAPLPVGRTQMKELRRIFEN
jgi:hypothetical protein